MEVVNAMKITNQGKVSAQKLSGASPNLEKNITDLPAGSKFKARIMDMQPNRVTIEMSSGDRLTARSHILPAARIGEDVIFQVKENLKGQISLEMLKLNDDIPANFVKEALQNAQLPMTDDNASMANLLLKEGLPVSADSLQKATYLQHISDSMSAEEIIFLVKEGFQPSEVNVNLLKQLSSGSFNINDSLQTIIDGLLKNDVDIAKIFPHDQNKQLGDAKHILESRFYVALKDQHSLESMGEHYKGLHKDISNIEEFLQQEKLDPALLSIVSNTKDQLDFMDHIKSYKEFMQIPFMLENEKKQGDLYVFKKKKNSKPSEDQMSALLSLDYAALGHIEIFINKVKQTLSLDFKATDSHSLKVIEANAHSLLNYLSASGYTIGGLSYKIIENKFNVSKDLESEKGGNKTRFSFDMRV